MPIFHLRAEGHWTGGDIWTYGIHVDSALTTTALATAWAAALTDQWTGAGTPAGALQTLYTDQIIVDNAVAVMLNTATAKQLERADVPLSIAGTSTGEQMPPQVALTVSLRTSLPTRAGRGRFYLPGMSTSVLANGRLAAANQTAVLNASARMLNSLIDAGATPGVWTTGLLNPRIINRVEVGDVFDTQRRRRDKLVESRVALPIP
jgi:hypothetical protein